MYVSSVKSSFSMDDDTDTPLTPFSTRLVVAYPSARLISWWRRIFSFYVPAPFDHLHLRALCRLFRDALPSPPPFVIFPHPSFESVDALCHGAGPLGVKWALISAGTYDFTSVRMGRYPIVIAGEGETKTFLRGKSRSFVGQALFTNKHFHSADFNTADFNTADETDDGCVVLRDLTLRPLSVCSGVSIPPGVSWSSPGSLPLKMINVTVNNCQQGLCASFGARVECTNLKVLNCERCGVSVKAPSIVTLQGESTLVDGNCTDQFADSFGLRAIGEFASIRLVAPLTRERVSVNNGGGGNWCGTTGGGSIEEWVSRTQRWHKLENLTIVRVPEECRTLEEAMERVKLSHHHHVGHPNGHLNVVITTIRLARGTHEVKGHYHTTASVDDHYVRIDQGWDIEICGAGEKETIVFGGGFLVTNRDRSITEGSEQEREKEKIVTLRDLTILRATSSGVLNKSGLPLRVINVTIEECGQHGLWAYDGATVDATNVTISKSGESGARVESGGSLVLRGVRTSVNGNGRNGTAYSYGVCVSEEGSTITVVSPLTKEVACTNNIDEGVDMNWGGWDDAVVWEIDGEGNILEETIMTTGNDY